MDTKGRFYVNSNDNVDEFNINVDLRSNKVFIILFYVGVVIPFIAYFLGIFIGGISINRQIMFYINYESELYHLSSYQNYNYYITLTAFFYQK